MATYGECALYPAIDIPPELTTPPDAITFLVNQLVIQGKVRPENADGVISHVLKRESLGSTAYYKRIAIPLIGSDLIEHTAVLVGRSSGIDWPGVVSSEPVRLVYLVLTRTDQPVTAYKIESAILEHHRGK